MNRKFGFNSLNGFNALNTNINNTNVNINTFKSTMKKEIEKYIYNPLSTIITDYVTCTKGKYIHSYNIYDELTHNNNHAYNDTNYAQTKLLEKQTIKRHFALLDNELYIVSPNVTPNDIMITTVFVYDIVTKHLVRKWNISAYTNINTVYSTFVLVDDIIICDKTKQIYVLVTPKYSTVYARNSVYVFDKFGQIIKVMHLNFVSNLVGVSNFSFSSDGTKLYLSNVCRLYIYDINKETNTKILIHNSDRHKKVLVDNNNDNKIYEIYKESIMAADYENYIGYTDPADMDTAEKEKINRSQIINENPNGFKIVSSVLHNEYIYVMCNRNIILMYDLKGQYLCEIPLIINYKNSYSEYIECRMIVHNNRVFIMIVSKNPMDNANFIVHELE